MITKGAAVVCLNHDGEVLLLERSMSASHHPGQWENPGGHIEGNEMPEDTARREVVEETGLQVESLRHLHTKKWDDDERGKTYEVWLFEALVVGEPVIEATFSRYRWVPKNNVQSVNLAPYVVQDFKLLGWIK